MTTPQAIARNANAIRATEMRRDELDGKYPKEWNNLPRTRKEAQELKVINYFTAKVCSNDHLRPRWTSTGQCLGCTDMWQKEKLVEIKEERAERIIAANETRVCPECKTEFLMTPEDRQDKIFCSKACAGAESKRNYVTTDPERRREQSARSANKFTTQRLLRNAGLGGINLKKIWDPLAELSTRFVPE